MRHRVIVALLLVVLVLPATSSVAARASVDDYRMLAVAPDDPAWAQQDEMRRIEADRAWDLTTGRPEIVIAVLDSGVNASHVDLAGRVLPGRNFVTGRSGQSDDDGHGTFTASVAAGAGNNGAGMAGVCWGCRVLPLKIFNRDDTSDTAFADAIRYAADNGARVINISAGGINPSPAIEAAVNEAADRGLLVVVSAGNTPDNIPLYPAAYDRVLAVAASGLNDNVTGFSTYADWVDLAAPGINITGADYRDPKGITRASGTSFSAPLVAGAAGLILSLRPELTADQTRQLLLDTAVDIGATGRDNNFGAGRLSVYDAVLAAASPAPTGDVTLSATTNGAQVVLTGAGFAPGEPVRAWLTSAGNRVIVMRGVVADAVGNVRHTANLTIESPPGPYRLNAAGDQSRRVAAADVTSAAASAAAAAFRPVPASAATGDRLHFTATQHTLGGAFRAFWETNGGLAIFGYPISEEFEENGRVVQYFERNRFGYHPEHRGTVHEVQLGLLGTIVTAGRAFPTAAPVASTATSRFFPETQHTLSDDFLRYWEANGAVAIFGYPISEPLTEGGRQVQYFQRNRFELHPEQGVQLGLLGRDLARLNGYLP